MMHPQDQVPDDLVELGRISDAYGIKGWIKVQPYSADAEVLLQTDQWWLRAAVPPRAVTPATPRSIKVLASRPQGATVVASVDGVADRDQALALKGHTVWISRSLFPPLDEDEVYWVDLIGCRLYGESDGASALIGEVVDVSDNGAHAILRVARADLDETGQLVFLRNASGKRIEVLVPFVRAHVHHVDIANKRLDSDWPLEL